MNRSVCEVCQQQFKTESGLSWHLDRIHERRSIDRDVLQSIAVPSNCEPRDLESVRADNRSRPEELDSERGLADLELTGASIDETDERDVLLKKLENMRQELEDMKNRLKAAERLDPTVHTLVAEIARRAEPDRKMSELAQAMSALLWALDRPNRGSTNLVDSISGLMLGPSELNRVRETIRASLYRSVAANKVRS